LFQLIINIRSLQSCPAINVYSTTNLERGLEAAAQNFCSQEVHVDMNAKRVRVHTPESHILSANKPSTSCVRTACPKLSTSLEQAVPTLLILSDLLQGCSNKSDTVMI
jgi:hypothetical protein